MCFYPWQYCLTCFFFFVFCDFLFYLIYVENKSLMFFFLFNFLVCVFHISMVLLQKSFFSVEHLIVENKVFDNSSKYHPTFGSFYFGIIHGLVSSVLLCFLIRSFINQKILVQKGYLLFFFFFLFFIVGYLIYLALMLQFVFFEALKKVAILEHALMFLINKVRSPFSDKGLFTFNNILDIISFSFLDNRFFSNSCFQDVMSTLLDFNLLCFLLVFYFLLYLMLYLNWCLIIIFFIFQIKLKFLTLCEKFPKLHIFFTVCYFFFLCAGFYLIVLSSVFIKFFFEYIFKHMPENLLLSKNAAEQWSSNYEMFVSIIFFFFFVVICFFFFKKLSIWTFLKGNYKKLVYTFVFFPAHLLFSYLFLVSKINKIFFTFFFFLSSLQQKVNNQFKKKDLSDTPYIDSELRDNAFVWDFQEVITKIGDLSLILKQDTYFYFGIISLISFIVLLYYWIRK